MAVGTVSVTVGRVVSSTSPSPKCARMTRAPQLPSPRSATLPAVVACSKGSLVPHSSYPEPSHHHSGLVCSSQLGLPPRWPLAPSPPCTVNQTTHASSLQHRHPCQPTSTRPRSSRARPRSATLSSVSANDPSDELGRAGVKAQAQAHRDLSLPRLVHALSPVKSFTAPNSTIPIQKWRSTKTGLSFVWSGVEGPIVSGTFVVPTEAVDDLGRPHTLEHAVFLGSDQYPFKGILDNLANRSVTGTHHSPSDALVH